MKTPVIDFINKYIESDIARFHMPGHKGHVFTGFESFDITEIEGSGSLYSREGAIAESEANATSLFGFGRTIFSAEGSSQCAKAMLYLARQAALKSGNPGRTVIAGRNAHKSFIQGCALNGLDVSWLEVNSEKDEPASICSCVVTPESIDAALDSSDEKPFAVYLTAPDYHGYSPDIAGIAKVCRKRGILLLVDNAHGAYLRFLTPSRHPVGLGAFMSCDSAHKTLPVLTGGAYLQLSKDVPEDIYLQAKIALALFGSTSPSYLILQSLDLCNNYLAEGYGEKLAKFVKKLEILGDELNSYGWRPEPSDPLKLIFDTSSRGYTGREIAALLRRRKIECEFADYQTLVLMVTPENTDEDMKRLAKAFKEIPVTDKKIPPLPKPNHPLRKAMSIREAVMSPNETVMIDKSVGRICASPAVSCPPEIPIAVSGEEIDEDAVRLMKAYGIKTVQVVIG